MFALAQRPRGRRLTPRCNPSSSRRRSPHVTRFVVSSWIALAACAEDEKLFNVFQPPPPVTEVACPGSDARPPWVAETSPVDRGLGDVWGTSATDVWIVGAEGTILHNDGSAWTQVDSTVVADLLAVHGTGEEDVWAVGRAGTVLHYDGDRWRKVETSSEATFVGVFAVALTSAWIIGDDGVHRWDGAQVVTSPDWPKVPINGVWASGPNDVHFVGDTATYRFDGTRFTTTPIANAGKLDAIWGLDPAHVWAIGHDAANVPGFAELEPRGWSFSAAPPRGVYFTLWTLDANELWAGANDTSIFYRANGTWCREHQEGIGALNAFWGADVHDIWAVGAKRGTGGASVPVLLRRRS